MINYADFAKLELKVGTILSAEEIEGSEKLLKLQVDFGPAPDGAGQDIRQVLSGIKKWYSPDKLVGKQFVFVTNLEPRIMMGLESQGMILAAGDEEPILLTVFKQVPSGSKVK